MFYDRGLGGTNQNPKLPRKPLPRKNPADWKIQTFGTTLKELGHDKVIKTICINRLIHIGNGYVPVNVNPAPPGD